MFDDYLNASLLIGLAGLAVGSVLDSAAPPPARAATTRVAAAPPPVAAGASATMPVYELPRVVVTGYRSRDGDMLAHRKPAPAGIAGLPVATVVADR